MRFNEVKKLIESDQDLFEINMSPSNLDKTARQIDARAGMEFEMIVPNAENDNSDDFESEPDYDQDQRSRSFSDIRDFFYSDHNGRRDVNDLIDRLEAEFYNWQDEQIFESWQDEGIDYLREYIDVNGYFDDAEADEEATNHIQAEYGDKLTPKEFEVMKQTYVKELFDQFVQQQWDDEAEYYEEAKDQYFDEQRSDHDEREWLDLTYPSMSDIASNFDINWPIWTEYEGNDGQSITDIADHFGDAVGRPWKASSGYHSGSVRRQSTGSDYYIIEPDGSLDPDDSDDAGLEFVSPPLTIDEMFSDLDKVKRWADREGCYTNDSTGLHINVSVPGYNLNDLDYVKLALLLGDKYVLDQFQRDGNTYCKSAMDEIKKRVMQRPEDAGALLQSMKNGLNKLASKVIHTGTTSKYTSINTKDNRIEFRSPGGDWLSDAFFPKIKPTLLRFVVAMDASLDPEKYRKEYLKKLYTLLQPKSKDDTLSYFAKFAAGELPKTALKSFVRQVQLERKLAKDPLGGQTWWWNVPYNGQRMEVVAKNKAEAKLAAAKEWGLTDAQAANISTVDIRPIRPYDTSPVRATAGEPQPVGRGNFNTPSQTDYENRLGWPDQTGDANYEIVRRDTMVPVFVFIANTDQDAARKYGQWLDLNGLPHETENYGYREIARPGSTLDLQRQRAAQPSQYEIYRISDGRTVEYNGQPLRVNATSIEDAEERARQVIATAFGGTPGLFDVRSVLQAPAQSSPGIEYIIFKLSDNSQLTGFRAANRAAADREAESILRDLGLDPDQYDVRERHPGRRNNEPQQWEMFNMGSGEVLGTFTADGYRAAERHIQQTIAAAGGNPDEYDARPVRARQPAQDVDIDVQPRGSQNLPATINHVGQQYTPTGSGSFTGQWLVLDPGNTIIYKFGGIGNNQSDANRVAMDWLTRNPRQMVDGVTVVPEMG